MSSRSSHLSATPRDRQRKKRVRTVTGNERLLGFEQLEDRRVLAFGVPELVKDINTLPLPVGSYPREITSVGSTAFFLASDAKHELDLWRTDGTSAGTSLVKDFSTATVENYPHTLTNVNGVLYFGVRDETILISFGNPTVLQKEPLN